MESHNNRNKTLNRNFYFLIFSPLAQQPINRFRCMCAVLSMCVFFRSSSVTKQNKICQPIQTTRWLRDSNRKCHSILYSNVYSISILLTKKWMWISINIFSSQNGNETSLWFGKKWFGICVFCYILHISDAINNKKNRKSFWFAIIFAMQWTLSFTFKSSNCLLKMMETPLFEQNDGITPLRGYSHSSYHHHLQYESISLAHSE